MSTGPEMWRGLRNPNLLYLPSYNVLFFLTHKLLLNLYFLGYSTHHLTTIIILPLVYISGLHPLRPLQTCRFFYLWALSGALLRLIEKKSDSDDMDGGDNPVPTKYLQSYIFAHVVIDFSCVIIKPHTWSCVRLPYIWPMGLKLFLPL